MKAILEQIALWCGLGSAAFAMASIAASQILLGIAILSYLLSGGRGHWRDGARWLVLFALWTLVSLAFSPDPAAGLPQVRKFYVLLAFPLLFANNERAWQLMSLGWLGLGTLSSLWGLKQFAAKWLAAQAAGEDFYLSYVAARITGFNSHWMTFSGQLMFALLIGAALVIWGRLEGWRRWAVACCLPVISLAMVLAWTRGAWIATGIALFYLLWQWKRRAALALPVLAMAAVLAGPASLQERAMSLVRPRGTIDSNTHRLVTLRTGVEMIRAQPLVGVGPERVGAEFMNYVPRNLLPLPEGYYRHLHSVYVHYSAERGIPAMLLIVWFFLEALWRWRRRAREGSIDPWIAHGCSACVIGLLVTGAFEYNLGDSEILMLALSVVAMGDRSPYFAHYSPASPPPDSASRGRG